MLHVGLPGHCASLYSHLSKEKSTFSALAVLTCLMIHFYQLCTHVDDVY